MDIFVAEMLENLIPVSTYLSPVIYNLSLPVLEDGLRPLYRHRHCQPPQNWGWVGLKCNKFPFTNTATVSVSPHHDNTTRGDQANIREK